MLAIWSLVPRLFLKPAWTSGSSLFTYCWNLAWRILNITSVWNECNWAVVWEFFGITFFGDWNENWLFQSCGHCWVFQICWHIECSTLTASSFRIWNSSTVIPSSPLVLFIMMLPKDHLTSHSRMSGSRWVWLIIPSWLSGPWRSSLYSSSVYSCHLFLLSSASVRSIPFLPFFEPIFAWNVPLVSLIFLKRSLVFPILLFSSVSLHWSLKKALLSLLAILWNSAFKWVYLLFSPLLFTSLLFTAICKASSDSHFAFLNFFFSLGNGLTEYGPLVREWQTTSVFLPREPHEQYERQNDRILKEELFRSVGVQYATGDQWRNYSRKNEGMKPSQNNTTLWMGLVIEARSDAVKSNIA